MGNNGSTFTPKCLSNLVFSVYFTLSNVSAARYDLLCIDVTQNPTGTGPNFASNI